uniref:SCAN box domain-containing protein n=1 Tax=Crocodylus porosus TaxID=8502 RepID=A0A7M4ES21_CROPO
QIQSPEKDAAYRAKTRGDALDYDKVKAEILWQLDITPERHCQAFRKKKPNEAKAPCILWQHLADLLSKWLRPETVLKEEICDQILLEQFFADLDEDTQKWVKCHCPASSRDALQLMEQFDMAQGDQQRYRGMKGPDPTPRRGTESKGGRRDGPHGLTCFLCGERGTLPRTAPRILEQGPPKTWIFWIVGRHQERFQKLSQWTAG